MRQRLFPGAWPTEIGTRRRRGRAAAGGRGGRSTRSLSWPVHVPNVFPLVDVHRHLQRMLLPPGRVVGLQTCDGRRARRSQLHTHKHGPQRPSAAASGTGALPACTARGPAAANRAHHVCREKGLEGRRLHVDRLDVAARDVALHDDRLQRSGRDAREGGGGAHVAPGRTAAGMRRGLNTAGGSSAARQLGRRRPPAAAAPSGDPSC